jgi:hypothetical protein
MKKYVYGLLVVVFIGILAYVLINNDYFFRIFDKRDLNCEDFSFNGSKVDCSYFLVDAGMTVKLVILELIHI